MNRRIFLGLLLAAGPALAEHRRDNREACARIDQRLKDIQSERRLGYTAKRGRKLQAQRDSLEEKRRLKCR
jgi:hypothetical protein